ncbi:phosphate signaling complex protein PhoU [candidate division WOR-3 bacterium]|nr:phosphate signaling complex protein PhoU [candidate division WOR-3 bacterium]
MTLLEEKIANLKEKLLAMAAAVEKMVDISIQSLVKRDHLLAEQVINDLEPKINQAEIEIEDTAINLIALHQPEASNLRTITMVIKINNDLERIGDHAVNIAEAALFLIPRPPVKPLIDLPRMAQHTIQMLRDSLDAFTKKDVELARRVCARDSIVDSLKDQINRELITYMTSDATTIDRALKLMLISLNLERIADLATNISEDVVYAVTGEVIKHGKCEPVT